MSAIDIDKVYTPQEVAKFLRCSPWTVNAMIDRGALPAKILTVGKKKMRRVTRSALEKFIGTSNVPEQQKSPEIPLDLGISNVKTLLRRKKKA